LDGDLRSGNVHEIFRVSAQPGWASAVVAGSSVDESVREVDLGGTAGGSLHVLPGGVVSSHPVEILMSDRFPAFLADLRERYDLVVIDTPSLADGHEAAVLAGHADGVLLVSRSDRTRKQALADAAHAVRRARGKVLGVVLTDVKAGARLGRVTR
jgi:Mrp family chromosome partitioning ATPase